jgi:hypothetical protein
MTKSKSPTKKNIKKSTGKVASKTYTKASHKKAAVAQKAQTADDAGREVSNPNTNMNSTSTPNPNTNMTTSNNRPVQPTITLPRNIAKVCGYSGAFLRHPDEIAWDIATVLTKIGNLYRYGNDVVIDTGENLTVLVENRIVRPETTSILANFVLIVPCREKPPQPPKKELLQIVFNNDLFLQRLPRIERYVTRPTYDSDFRLLQPGYDVATGIMVHGDAIEPIPFVPSAEPEKSIPPIIREMYADFPFATPVDRVNAVGLLFVAILAHLFTATGRAVGLFDGNQAGVGKTLLAKTIGIILDGTSPAITEFTNSNDELGRRICATIRSHNQSVLLIDNARTGGGVLNSTSLESMSAAETLSFRMLGRSKCHTCTNDYLWMLTMNGLRATPDLAGRGIRILLSHEGSTSLRKYQHKNLEAFVKEHRNEITATIFGMIEYWKSREMPRGTASHRFTYMAEVISGILDSCGITGFLSNHQESLSEIDATQDVLAALFETTVKSHTDDSVVPDIQTLYVPSSPQGSQEWLPIVVQSGIAEAELNAAKTDRAKAVKIGIQFSGLLNRGFNVEVGNRTGKARLLKVEARKRVGYQFEVVLDPAELGDESNSVV